MRNIFLFLTLLCVTNIFAETLSLNRTMSVSDPNRNSNWDWSINQPHNLYANTAAGLVTYPNVRLPWFNNAGPASYLGTYPQIDFKKNEGWTLLYRDFGTISSGASPMPFFIMYNKNRGLLRVFFYNTISLQGYSFAMLKLNISGTSTSPLLTYSDSEKPFLNDYASDIVISSVFKMPSVQWTFADLNIIGYDNALSSKNLLLQFELIGVNETDLKLTGGITLEQLVGSSANTANIGFSGKSDDLTGYLSAATSPFSKAWNNFKEYNKAGQDLTAEAAKPANQGKWYSSALTSIANLATSSPLNFIPGIAAAAGFIDGVVGLFGGNMTQQPTPIPLNFKGNLELTGKMTNYNPLATFYMFVPASSFSPTDSRAPLDNAPLGIFNIANKPTLEYCTEIVDRWITTEDGPRDIPIVTVHHKATLRFAIKDPVMLVQNSSLNLRLVSSKLSLGSNSNGPETKYCDLITYNSTKYNSVTIQNYYFKGNPSWQVGAIVDLFSASVPNKMIMELKYVSNTNSADTVYFLKTFPISIAYNPNVMSKPSIVPPQNINIAPVYTSGQYYPKITWSANTELNISGYQIWKRIFNGNNWNSYSLAATINSPTTQWLDYNSWGAGGGAKISEYKIRAVDNQNNVSAFTEPKQINWGIFIAEKKGIQIEKLTPDKYALEQNFPNPFNPSTSIKYEIPEDANISIKVFNILGSEVATLVNEFKTAGYYEINFDASKLSSGMYVYRINSGRYSEIRKMMLLK